MTVHHCIRYILDLWGHKIQFVKIIAGRGGMGAGTGGAGWASAHPGKNQGGHEILAVV